MKTLIQIIRAFILILVFSPNSFSQEIELNLNFTGDTVVYPFENIEIISELSMYGDIEFYSDTSLVRLILEDVNGFQYMIYESYPLISTRSNFTAEEYCDETCALDDCHPYSLIIQVTGAEIFLRYLS